MKALNYIPGPEWSFPSVFVFGEFSLRDIKSEQKSQRLNIDERAAIDTLARKEMKKSSYVWA